MKYLLSLFQEENASVVNEKEKRMDESGWFVPNEAHAEGALGSTTGKWSHQCKTAEKHGEGTARRETENSDWGIVPEGEASWALKGG